MTATVEPAAILISGRGSNMSSILDLAEAEGWLDAVKLVLSNRPAAPGLDLAGGRGVATDVLNHRSFGRGNRAAFDAALAERLLAAKVRWVVLAGFMRILGADFVSPFAGRILNIHPSLLPRHPGLHTHQRALDAGDSEHGCTVHLVDDTLDGGPILAQARVPVLPGDDADALAARVLVQEHRLYPAVVRSAVRGSLGRDFPAHSQREKTA